MQWKLIDATSAKTGATLYVSTIKLFDMFLLKIPFCTALEIVPHKNKVNDNTSVDYIGSRCQLSFSNRIKLSCVVGTPISESSLGICAL